MIAPPHILDPQIPPRTLPDSLKTTPTAPIGGEMDRKYKPFSFIERERGEIDGGDESEQALIARVSAHKMREYAQKCRIVVFALRNAKLSYNPL